MRIPLQFNKDGKRVSVAATIKYGEKIMPAIFVVDTGGTETFIDEFTASKSRIFTKNLEVDTHIIIGGTKIALYKLGKVTLIFRDKDGNPRYIEFSNLRVSESMWSRKGAIYPPISIIGLDFFIETKLNLFLSPFKREGYITDEGL
jgi:hypothetical protein